MGSEDENFQVDQRKNYQSKRFLGGVVVAVLFFFYFCNIFFFQGYVFIFEIRTVSIEIHWLVRSFGGLHLDFPGMTSDWPQNFWGPELSNVSSRRMETWRRFFGFGVDHVLVYQFTLHQAAWPCDVYSIFTEIPVVYVVCCSRNVDEARVVWFWLQSWVLARSSVKTSAPPGALRSVPRVHKGRFLQ